MWQKTLLIALLTITHIGLADAQIGIGMYYSQTYSSGFQEEGSDQDLFTNELIFGVDYWIRLKNLRIEFLPSFTYGVSKDNLGSDQSLEVTLNSWSLLLRSNIYFLDFFNDCQCPTFSKQNQFVKKGMHAQIGLGYNEITFDPQDESDFQNMLIQLGLGLDIGISNFITLTPYLVASHHLPLYDKADKVTIVILPTAENRGSFIAGVRLGVRWDTKNFY